MTNKKTILAGILLFALILVIGYFLKPNADDYKDNGSTSQGTIQRPIVDETAGGYEALKNIMS
ncbi:MAG TPA: hypothetical protein GX707_16365 [Epulopiscium sp.]|nr:hypothetical protein [Candidatus Epulonipiscium sp.]